MGVPSVSGTSAFSGQDSLALTRAVGAVGSSQAAACPSCKPPRDEPPEGHSVSRAGCSKVWSPFPASSWRYWDDFGLVFFSFVCLLAAQGAALSAGYKKFRNEHRWDRMNYFPGFTAGIYFRRSQFNLWLPGQAEGSTLAC